MRRPINVPVAGGGVLVRPGDVIVADGSGVCCIPAEYAAKVAELAQTYMGLALTAKDRLKIYNC